MTASPDIKDYFVEVGGNNIQVSIGSNPSVRPRALIVYTFGIPRGCENDKSYRSFRGVSNYLMENYVCVTFCPAGMGKSTGDTTSLSLRSRFEELAAVIDFSRDKYPDLPLFLNGVSMGAHITLSSLDQINPKGIILISPAVYPDRSEESLFDGVDFAKTARLKSGDDPTSFTVTRSLLRYAGPVMLVWLEKDRLSRGGPIWDVIYDSVNLTMKDRKKVMDKVLYIDGLEHGFKLGGIYPGPDNPRGSEALIKVASEVDLFIKKVL